jgi:hypothetical protein
MFLDISAKSTPNGSVLSPEGEKRAPKHICAMIVVALVGTVLVTGTLHASLSTKPVGAGVVAGLVLLSLLLAFCVHVLRELREDATRAIRRPHSAIGATNALTADAAARHAA